MDNDPPPTLNERTDPIHIHGPFMQNCWPARPTDIKSKKTEHEHTPTHPANIGLRSIESWQKRTLFFFCFSLRFALLVCAALAYSTCLTAPHLKYIKLL
jgi:hypothetical protein